MLRDLPQPNLNDVLKSNSYSAIKLLKTGKYYKMLTLRRPESEIHNRGGSYNKLYTELRKYTLTLYSCI